jgi:hypothetical protein
MTPFSSIVSWNLAPPLDGELRLVAVSGHGGQTKDMDKDEVDGYDEGVSVLFFDFPSTIYLCMRQVIYPCDYETAGHLVDDVRHCLA